VIRFTLDLLWSCHGRWRVLEAPAVVVMWDVNGGRWKWNTGCVTALIVSSLFLFLSGLKRLVQLSFENRTCPVFEWSFFGHTFCPDIEWQQNGQPFKNQTNLSSFQMVLLA
jgi:hypothetical protein